MQENKATDMENEGNASAVPQSELIEGLGGGICLFCDDERSLKPNCTKQRWKVCGRHFMVICPLCGHEAFWMEGMKRGDYYACFSLSCDWTNTVPPNAYEIRG
jgi:hypothetical protein